MSESPQSHAGVSPHDIPCTGTVSQLHRKSIRLHAFDYSQPGAYFVTICTHHNTCLFGDVIDDSVHLNQFGDIARQEWLRTADVRPSVTLDAFVVMPNHLHGILVLAEVDRSPEGTQLRAPTREHFAHPTHHSVPTILRMFKACVTLRINVSRDTPDRAVWQRGYYDHVIRDAASLDRAREYIQNNPLRWTLNRPESFP